MEAEAAGAKEAGVAAQTLSLPKGGGAVSGLEAEASASAFSGTFSVSIAIPLTLARDLSPSLSLSYDSGNGNGIFGVGFTLGVPSIARKTTKRIPRYDETDDFVSSTAGDLTRAASSPVSAPGGGSADDEWEVTSYVPRQAQGFPLFEHRVNRRNGVSYWIEYRGDETTHVYGETALARIANPDDETQVFEWLVEDDRDAKGNRVRYSYDQDADALPERIYDVNRSRTAQKYLTRIAYGNYFVDPGVDPPVEAFAFEVRLDYGDDRDPAAGPARRADPFSTYRSGFEIRTTRLCHALRMYHHFAELGPEPWLVRETRFTYDDSPTLSRLLSVQEIGYRRQPDGSIWRGEKPSVDLTFSEFVVPRFPIFEPLQIDDGGTLPDLPNTGAYQFIDLKGEGLPGVLLSTDETTCYYAPEGETRYASPQAVPQFPNARDLASGQIQLTDLNADGLLDLVDTRGTAGFFAQRPDGSWAPFQAFSDSPTATDQLEPVDLDGSGRQSLLLVGASDVTLYRSTGTKGYAAPVSEPKATGFPAAINLDQQEIVLFADMFGDGLAHRVRVRDGQVQAWPNLGFGRFGPPVTFGKAPRLAPDATNARIYLADLDGSGPADLIVAYADRLEIHLNRSGNTFSDPIVVQLPNLLGDGAQITFADIGGSGTSAIVFSTLTPRPQHWACHLGRTKPYLLTRLDNGLGVLTTPTYASSVKFYLEDKAAGRPWVTRLPFPVQVVERIDHVDEVSRTLMVTRYRYHDGYYDAGEKQFAGFGYVESWDAEHPLEHLRSAAAHGLPSTELIPERALVMPTHARTWFYTGAFEGEPAQTAQYRREYFHGDAEADADFPGPVFDPRILAGNAELLRQAWWSLKGHQRRQETYGDDQQPDAGTPFLITEQNYLVDLAQPAIVRFASLLTTSRETISYHYERDARDPRIAHLFALSSDAYGNTTLNAEVAYPRRAVSGQHVYPEQAQLHVRLEQTAYINQIAKTHRRIGLLYETRQLETHAIVLEGHRYFPFDVLARQVEVALRHEVPYGAPFTPGEVQARLFTWVQTYFWDTGLTHALGLGEAGTPALVHHARETAFTDEWLAMYGSRVTTTLLEEQAGFTKPANGGGYWWRRKPITYYLADAGQFYQPHRWAFDFDPDLPLSDGLRVDRRVTFAAPYYLAPVEQRVSVNATVEQVTTASIDYYTMQPWQLVDSNGIHHQVLYDPLKIVIATSIFKMVDGQREGDGDLSDFVVRTDATFASVLDNPPLYLEKATTFLFYDLLAWRRHRTPAGYIELQRQRHVSDLPPGAAVSIKTLIGYFDGFARVVERKLKADAAEVPAGTAILVHAGADATARWIVSERTIYNNKAKPAEKYLPYVSDTPAFDPVLAAAQAGLVPPPERLFYDALIRVIRVETPKGFLRRTEITAWAKTDFDEDDTVLDAPYYEWFMAHYPQNPTQAQKDEKAALDKAAAFYNTPLTDVFDSRGYRIRVIASNLGNVPPDAFTAIVEGSGITSQQLWQDIIDHGYLATTTLTPAGTYVTWTFQPYTLGFAMTLGPDYQRFAEAVVSLLRQSVLTTFEALDARQQRTVVIDPRLYLDVVRTGVDVANLRYAYPMHDKTPWQTHSTDAGVRWVIKNVHEAPCALWDSRGFASMATVDRLQRMLTTDVTGPLGASFRAEQVTYGDGRPDAAAHNLWGQVYEYRDGAGLIVNQAFTLEAQLAETHRRFRIDYRGQVNWLESVGLQDKPYRTATTYNVQQDVLTRTTDDGNRYAAGYYVSGRLRDVRETWADGSTTSLIDAIAYMPAGHAAAIYYGNQVTVKRAYELTTQRLIAIVSDSAAPSRVFQHITYTYDPVGNATLMRDLSAETVFCYNQQAEAKGDYTYDALYRLVHATGRQHPGIKADTHINGFKQSIFAELCPPNPNDQVKLEPYAETYRYDDSNNLVRLAHHASSVSFVSETPVDQFSNRLADYLYDDDGNGLDLSLNNVVSLTWDYAGHLAQTTLIEREEQPNDQLFFNYDHAGQRVRKVTERLTQGGTVTEVEDWLYVDTYQQRVTHKNTAAAQEAWISAERLRLPAGQETAATVYTWIDEPVRHRARAIAPARAGGAHREIRLPLSNLQGSISVEVDFASATVVSYEEYYPFGGTAVIAGPSKAAVVPKVFRYSNQECDDATGLYYYGARYFVPWQRRWITADPAGDVDGPNLYAFVANNPITRRDQHGLVWRSVARWHQLTLANSETYAALIDRVNSSNTNALSVVSGHIAGRGDYDSDTNTIRINARFWQYDAYRHEWQIDEVGWSVAVFETTNALHRSAFVSLMDDVLRSTVSDPVRRSEEQRSYARQTEGVEYSGTGLHHLILRELRGNAPGYFPRNMAHFSNGSNPLWDSFDTYETTQQQSGHTDHYYEQYNQLRAPQERLARRQERQRQLALQERQREQRVLVGGLVLVVALFFAFLGLSRLVS